MLHFTFLHSAIVDQRCPDIPNPTNGRIDFTADDLAPFDVGTTATYVCDQGYVLLNLNGGDTIRIRTCVLDNSSGIGLWNGSAPSCVGWSQN